MSTPVEQLRQRAEDARKSKNFTQAADIYSELLEQIYKPDEPLSAQLCKDFTNYGECLINTGETDEETWETAWEVLENARVGYEQLNESERPPEALIDVHELLGELQLKQQKIEGSIEEYDKAFTLAQQNPNLSWRLSVNALYMKSICLKILQETQEYKNVLNQAIDLVEKAKADPKNAADLQALDEIKADFISRRDAQ